MFPNNLFISDSSEGLLYEVENKVASLVAHIHKEVRSILIAQNMNNIYTVNRDNDSITRIVNDTVIGDIPVGKTPYGICEDPNGNIYVTNYGDNTVTMITSDLADSHVIRVGRGPRGIVSDNTGTIWVANYLDNTVSKIINKKVIDTIKVGANPDGITCDINGGIWVACSGSNVVAKIVKDKKKYSIVTGKCPVAVLVDKRMTVYVANYEDDTVTMINTIGGLDENGSFADVTTISVGDGPTALALDTSGFIYVNSNLSGEDVKVINPKAKEVVDTIHVCKNPCAYGDFTGCATFNVFNPHGIEVQNSGISENAEKFLNVLEPTFKITEIEEHADYTTFKIGSDMVNVDKFLGFKLNTIDSEAEDIKLFKLQKNDIGAKLYLSGYLTDDNSSKIVFDPVAYKDIFNVKFGIVDDNFDNYREIGKAFVDFANNTLVTATIKTPILGHVVALIPIRIYLSVKNYLTLGSGFNYGNAWIPEDGDTNVTTISNQLTEEERAVYTVLYNPETMLEDSMLFFHFYKATQSTL